MLTIATARLDLVSGTIALLDAELESNNQLASLLGARVPVNWPPGEYDRAAIELLRECFVERPESAGWYSWYALLRGTGGEPHTLVGAGGYLGPPNTEGVLEIGYSVAPDFEGRGIATELVHALLEHAFATKRVRRIIAHTMEENRGSVKVLERAGFRLSDLGQASGSIEFALQCPATHLRGVG